MKMFYCKITNKMFTSYMRQYVLLWIFLNFKAIYCQLFSMDQSKILRIYGDILPKQSSSKNFDNETIVPTTEKLHVKHYSNSKIDSYLATIHKKQLFEQNQVEPEVTPKTISEVNSMFNHNQNSDWAPTDSFHPSWDDSHHNSGRNYQNSDSPSVNRNPGWSVTRDQVDDDYFSPTTENSNNHNQKHKKRQDSSYYNTDSDYSASNKELTDWSTQSNNFVTPPKETRQQYSTIYKQHKTKSNQGKDVRDVYNDWSTPRSMSAYSEWLTTPQPYTTLDAKPHWVPEESSNNWSPSNYDTKWETPKTTITPSAEPLSTAGPDLDEFIARQENRYKKYNNLYSGVNSYGDPSQDILNKPRDYRQTPNSNNNFNPILKEQFDIPPNIQSYDPYSEYQDFSSSTSYYPHSSTDNFISSTTKKPYFDNNFQSNIKPTRSVLNLNNNLKYNNGFANNDFNGNGQGFGEPETVIENKYQTTLKKHFDNTINLYESQSKRTKFNPQQGGGGKYNVELPASNIKFEVSSTDNPPNIVIKNYHFTTDHPQNGYSEVYNQQNLPTPHQPHFQVDNAPQFSQNDLQLPANYDYSPKKSHEVTFTTESSIPIVEIGGYNKSPSRFYEGNHTFNPPPVTYEIPHLQKTEKKKPHINWCRLKSKRYITDKRCVSMEPVVESVCSDNCVMPPKGRGAHPPPPKKRRKSAPSSWTCVESNIAWKKIKLRCQDKSIRWYNLKVVNGCDCRKKPIKITKRITIRN